MVVKVTLRAGDKLEVEVQECERCEEYRKLLVAAEHTIWALLAEKYGKADPATAGRIIRAVAESERDLCRDDILKLVERLHSEDIEWAEKIENDEDV